ncbi:hypothetical protein [Pseudomonas poae]|uniref:Zinc ribbon domain-containing protein n=1 Tax=Pseudomonas poae TaxID=200451 RepID=A0ABY0RBF8_9PSED|nr:hypothetical protein [Pseudomonas poae]KRP44094.1 hypothetical protein TU75_22730 [Pseudomonas poae]SDN51521.1 hypothetical protein SAMN04490208_0555 [Pseudomonas poae]
MDGDKIERLKLIRKSGEGETAPHMSRDAFSKESEQYFSDRAASKRKEIEEDVVRSLAYKADYDLDDLTRELRLEFARLNKIIELREVAKQKGTKQSRKAAQSAIKEAKKASKTAKKEKSVSPPKRTKPSIKEPESKWVRKVCWRCQSKFSIHIEWQKPPTLCPVCTKDIDETHLSSAPHRSMPKGWVQIVSGGAPGMGKRR